VYPPRLRARLHARKAEPSTLTQMAQKLELNGSAYTRVGGSRSGRLSHLLCLGPSVLRMHYYSERRSITSTGKPSGLVTLEVHPPSQQGNGGILETESIQIFSDRCRSTCGMKQKTKKTPL
jgi:hypothetical protein